MRNPLTTLGTYAVVIAAGLALGSAAALVSCQPKQPARDASAGVLIKAQDATQAATANAVQSTAEFEADAKTLTESNDATIKAAPGASATVDPRASCAAIRAICLRDSYRGGASCGRLLKPCAVVVAPGGARR